MKLIDLPYHLRHAAPLFDDIRQDADVLAEQNAMNQQDLNEDDRTALADMQQETWENIQEQAERAPYAELVAAEALAESQLISARKALAVLEEAITPALAKLDNDVKLALQVAPGAAERLQDIADKKRQALRTNDMKDLDAGIAYLEKSYNAVREMYDMAGRAWPVPQVIDRFPQPETFDDETIDVPAETAVTVGQTQAVGAVASTAVIISVPSETLSQPQKKKPETVPEWHRELRVKVGEAINSLESDGLMEVGAIPARTASIKSSSKKIGTKEAVVRLMRAHILPEVPERYADQIEVSARELVLMHIFNGTSQLSRRNRSLQREALKVIDDAIASYFSSRQFEEQSD